MALEDRRPIRARSITFIQRFASWLARTNVTPNKISILSVLLSLLVPLAFWMFEPGLWPASVLALLGIQLRLMCNLLDGMVAIEGGKKSVLGSVYNEFPDRIADTVILVGVAMMDLADSALLAIALAAALLAVMTAYTRVLGASVGAKHSFLGPMAKQHRMAILSLVVASLPILTFWIEPVEAIRWTLIAISIGCVITVYRRLRQIGAQLSSAST